MKTFKEHLAEGSSRGGIEGKIQSASSASRNNNFEDQLVIYYNGNFSDNDKKAAAKMNKKDKEVSKKILENFSNSNKWTGSKYNLSIKGKSIGSGQFKNSKIMIDNGSIKDSTVSKSDIILGGKRISLKMQKPGTISLGSQQGKGSKAIFLASLEGPLPLKNGVRGFINTLEKRMEKDMIYADIAGVSNWIDHPDAKAANDKINKAKKIRTDYVDSKYKIELKNLKKQGITDDKAKAQALKNAQKDAPEAPKQSPIFRELWKSSRLKRVKIWKEFNKDAEKLLQTSFTKNPHFKFNVVFNESTGHTRFGTKPFNAKSIYVADHLVCADKNSGQVYLLESFGTYKKPNVSFISKLTSKATIGVSIGIAEQDSRGRNTLKQGKLAMYAGYEIESNLSKIDSVAENYIAEELAKLENDKYLTEWMITDKAKEIFNKAKDFISKSWAKLVEWIGDSWERLLEFLELDAKVTYNIKI